MKLLKKIPPLGLRKRLGLWRSEDGSAAVEAVIVLPALAALYCASFVWFDAFRHNTLSMKATYVISDILSRDSVVNNDYLDELNGLAQFLVPSYAPIKMRVTLIHYNDDVAEDNKYRLMWSYGTNGMEMLTQSDLDTDQTWIPLMGDDDAVVVTETRILYHPLFSIGWSEDTVWHNIMATRPRFDPTLTNTDAPDLGNNIDDIDNEGDGSAI